jgi:hypothetical protein
MVSERALGAARDRVELLLAGAPRLRRNLEAGHFELHVIGLEQFPSDLPEFAGKRGSRLGGGELFDWHMIGGHLSEGEAHLASCSEGTLLPIVGFRLFGDETCIHELAHAIEWFALDASTRERIVTEYRASLDSERWKGMYAASNPHEWFAEVTKFYFRRDRDDLAFYDPQLARGHDWLCRYDERACRFVDDLYHDRLDPGVPKATVVAPAPGSSEGATRSGVGQVPVRVVVRNRGTARIHVIWIDFDGKRDPRLPFAEQHAAAPGEEVAEYTWATHVFVVTDDAERALCTFTAPDEDAVVDIAGECR